MKILILILIGLSAYMWGVVTAILRGRRKCTGKGEKQTGAGKTLPDSDLNLNQKNFLNYDGTIQN